MATSSFSSSSSLLLILALSSLIFSCSAQSSGCKSQTFSNSRNFSQCVDLPYLNSTLHWTFDSKTSNLTLAFTATPANTGGWVAWGINPTGLKMLGTQALVAYTVGGVPVVRTFNLSSFDTVVEGKISYAVSNLTAEMSGDGKMSIFATVTLPNSTINQVWQVGPGVTGGKPLPHAMNMENMMSTGVLNLVEGGGGAPGSPPTGAPPPGTGGGVPISPPVGAPSPTHSDGGVLVPPPAQASSPTPSGGGVPVPPSVGGGGVSPPPQAGAPSPIGGNSGNKISNKNGSVILCLFFMLLFSST